MTSWFIMCHSPIRNQSSISHPSSSSSSSQEHMANLKSIFCLIDVTSFYHSLNHSFGISNWVDRIRCVFEVTIITYSLFHMDSLLVELNLQSIH